jgi:tetratricopeptide (TPR) repeat protein
LNDKAIQCWLRAGEIAMERFAVVEAGRNLRSGLKRLEKLLPSEVRDLLELDLRTALAPAVVAQRGWGHDEVSAVLEPAWALAEVLEQRSTYLPILIALWVHYMCNGQLRISLHWADKLQSIGSATGDDSLKIVGHRAAAASHYWLGDFTSARRHGDWLRTMYDIERHWHIAQLTNFDPLTGEGIYRGQYLWMLGYPEQARAATDAMEEHARQRYHAFDLALALTLGAQVFDHLCEPGELLRRAEQAEQIGRERGVPLLWEIMAEISRGIALLRAGEASDSVKQLGSAILRLSATGHRIWLSYLRALTAEGLARSGDLVAAASIVEQSASEMSGCEERAHYAEVLRLQGWIYSLQNRLDHAEVSLRSALDTARKQQAKGWELRAATTLASVWRQRGECAAARELLQPVYDWFQEGFATRDLREAATLLTSLGQRLPASAALADH